MRTHQYIAALAASAVAVPFAIASPIPGGLGGGEACEAGRGGGSGGWVGAVEEAASLQVRSYKNERIVVGGEEWVVGGQRRVEVGPIHGCPTCMSPPPAQLCRDSKPHSINVS